MNGGIMHGSVTRLRQDVKQLKRRCASHDMRSNLLLLHGGIVRAGKVADK
ncbi:hypothetical protein KCP77_24890 (plasmid) [Salmonella enterica subsp. enterica]|nr:hypothetical protein KCP77_24890 [Salmonella enterica subsp. enterica]